MAQVATVALLVVLGLARPAWAAQPSALVVFGNAESRPQAIVLGVVDRVLRQAGWPLVPALSEVDSKTVRECLGRESPWPCIQPMADKKGIERIVAVRVDLLKANGVLQTVLTGRLVQAGFSSVLQQQRFCGACSDSDLTVYSEEIAKLLMDERAVQAGTTKVEVTSTPAGAEILIDGKSVGVANNTFATFPGRHLIEARLPGHKPDTRTVTAIDGKTIVATMTLEVAPKSDPVAPVAAPPKPAPAVASTAAAAPTTVIRAGTGPAVTAGSRADSGSSLRRYAPMALVGIGAATMIAGGVLWGIDEDKKLFATQQQLDMNPTFRDSAKVGVPMLIGGAVVAAAGGLWWWKASPSKPTPTIATSSQGVVLGLLGSF
jgi:PEGA domain